MTLPIVRTVPDLRAAVAAWRAQGLTVGLVPTMGALHEGHLSLVRLVKARADRCVASLFVNPKQFAAHEDLDRYPRDEAGDAAKLAGAGCDLLWAPAAAVMYPPGFATAVTVSGVSEGLETAVRPHFFGGVATVVTKLLLQAAPDIAAFGEKDYQQLLVIRKLTVDLDIPVTILAGETVREADGTAMSSRNAYLSPEERAVAGRLNVLLFAAADALTDGAAVGATLDALRADLTRAGFDAVEYAALCDAETLSPLDVLYAGARLLAAVRVGATRLIDNVAVTPRR
ncbi:MAG: pantoate--beta-alanine ligase [Hyphomonadaceae bacterium]|nr:pantoate--beta-alanine ligase [Hyphomonadaceae bacterium]